MENRWSISRPTVSGDFLMGAFVTGLLAVLLFAFASRRAARTERAGGERWSPDGAVAPHEVQEPHTETVWRGVPTA